MLLLQGVQASQLVNWHLPAICRLCGYTFVRQLGFNNHLACHLASPSWILSFYLSCFWSSYHPYTSQTSPSPLDTPQTHFPSQGAMCADELQTPDYEYTFQCGVFYLFENKYTKKCILLTIQVVQGTFLGFSKTQVPENRITIDLCRVSCDEIFVKNPKEQNDEKYCSYFFLSCFLSPHPYSSW